MRLSTRVQAISPSPTVSIDAKAKEMARQGIDVISFGVGEPDFDTPGNVKAAAVSAIEGGFTKYTPVLGIPELREAVAAKLRTENGLDYRPDQILVSSGAKESLYHAVMALCEPGDEVFIPAPYWVTYPEQVKLAGGTPVVIEATAATDFKVTPGMLRERLTPRTRLLLLNSPSNPTGAVYTREELAGLAAFCVEHRIAVIADEIYEKLIYEGEPVSIASFGPEIKALTVVVNGVSKSHAMTGWRIGYAAGDPGVIKAMSSLQSHSTTHPCSIAQKAAVEALRGPQDEPARMRAEFRKRRDYLLGRLEDFPGFRTRKPAGAFYVFPNVEGLLGSRLAGREVRTDLDLAEVLLTEARVAVVPGTAFGAPGHLRISYAASMERLAEGMDRIEALLRTVEQVSSTKRPGEVVPWSRT